MGSAFHFNALAACSVLALISLMSVNTPRIRASEPDDLAMPDFAKQIVPLLTKAGCNTGACHGAAAGRGYLQLSLFGSRPASDYEAIRHAPGQRFVDCISADSSLLLQKPAELLSHGGGERLPLDGNEYNLLSSWIQAGGPRGSLAKLNRIEFVPAEVEATSEMLLPIGESLEIGARAFWSDHKVTDATQWMTIEGASAEPDRDAVSVQWESGRPRLRANRVGVWNVSFRIASVARTVQIVAQPRELLLTSPVNSANDSIDRIVQHANNRLGSQVAGPVASHLLARRLWIDLVGRHPTYDEWMDAVKLIEGGGKAALIDRLLDSEAFAEYAGQQFMRWVRTSSTLTESPELDGQLSRAIAERLARDDRLLPIIRDMLSPNDSSGELAGFHRYAREARQRAELIASTFMGVRIGCAHCHDHPLDHWTQDDYFAFAACWAEIETGAASGNTSVRRIAGRTTTDLRSGNAAVAVLPTGVEIASGVTPDVAFTDWLCDSQNEYIANNLANRLWHWTFGQGLVVAIDDQRETNPPSNRELLRYVSKKLQRNEFRLRPLLREILLSETYARASLELQGAPSDEDLLRVKLAGVRSAKSIDSIAFAELARQGLSLREQVDSQENSSHGTTMMAEATEPSGCSRATSCRDPFAASLELVAGSELNAMLEHPANSFNTSLRSTNSIDLALTGTFERLFGESPDAATIGNWQQFLQSAPPTVNAEAIVTDVIWSWLVSDAFRKLQ